MGNFLYPKGMASTKRIQNNIDVIVKSPDASVSLLILRQSHAGSEENQLSGLHHGVRYRTIGYDVKPDWKLPFALLKYLLSGVCFLANHRHLNQKNIIYLYMEPNVENVLFLATARLIGYRIIVDITEDCYFVGSKAHLFSRIKAKTVGFFSRHLYVFVKGIIVISSQLYRKFESMYAGRVPVYLLPVSVNLENFSSAPSAYRGPWRILYAGSFGEKDSVENLIGAFDVLCKTHDNLRLILTGKMVSSERFEIIMNKITGSPYRQKIEYKGYLDDVEFYGLLNACDIPCMIRAGTAYANAGFPFKLGEYLATGKPVIASNVGDVGEYLENRVSALLIDSNTVDSIADAIEYIITHPDAAKEIGSNGKQVAINAFSTDVVGNKLLEILHGL